MIRLSGFSEDDIRIELTGLRPGEKLYEELLSDRERTVPTPHPKLRVAKAEAALGEEWLCGVEDWVSQARWPRDDEVRQELARRVPEYRPATG